MPKSPDHLSDDFEEVDVLQGTSDLDGFIESMEQKHEKSTAAQLRHARSGRQRLDEYRENRWLRDQLQDWDDWD